MTHLVLNSKLYPQLWTSCSLSRPLISPWSSLPINLTSAFLVTSGLLLCHTYFHSFRFTMLQLHQHFQSKCDTFHSSGRKSGLPTLLFFSKYTRKHQKSVDESWGSTWRAHDAILLLMRALYNWYNVPGLVVLHPYSGVVLSVPWRPGLRLKSKRLQNIQNDAWVI